MAQDMPVLPLEKTPTSCTATHERERYVEALFTSIANRYDVINSVISLGRHKAWRRFAVSLAGLSSGGKALDVCCGTGDFAVALARVVGPDGVVRAVDFSERMLELARRKAQKSRCPQIEFLRANACALPFPDNFFDCATIGFGLRNVADLRLAISEMRRVIKPGGRIVSLEIFGLRSGRLSRLWKLYFDFMVPLLGRLICGGSGAYKYLSHSVKDFVSPADLEEEFRACGLTDVTFYELALGTVCVHVATKPLDEHECVDGCCSGVNTQSKGFA